MRTNLDFTPFFRSSVGFDRIFDLLESSTGLTTAASWPTYDIAKVSDDGYRITLAVPGFSMDDIEITQQANLLVVTGKSSGSTGPDGILHKGIPSGSFTQRFELADHVDVTGARLNDGLLTIDMKREVPEAMKPRQIAIGSGSMQPEAQKQIGAQKAA